MRYSQSIVLLVAALALASCSSPSVPPATDLDYASRLIQRTEVSDHPAEQIDGEPAPSGPKAVALPAAKGRADEWRGLVELPADRVAELESVAAEDAALTKALSEPISLADLAALAVLRSPDVRQARAKYEAARTAYSQSRDLGDLVGLYRSFTRDLRTRVGPERSRAATEMIAPSPNVSGLSGEIAHRTTEMAFESLRATIRDVVARAWRAHADAARLHEARQIVREEVDLDEVLLEVLRSRLEAGKGSQAGFLAFQSRLERLRTDLEILDRRETVVRAQWNRLLSRAESAPAALDVAPTPPATSVRNEADVIALTAHERQELRAANLAAQRAELAVRLAETMTLPRMDVGSSRFERERTGEAGTGRGSVFRIQAA